MTYLHKYLLLSKHKSVSHTESVARAKVMNVSVRNSRYKLGLRIKIMFDTLNVYFN